MNIDSLLDLGAAISASSPDGRKVGCATIEVEEEDTFVFVPDSALEVAKDGILKISDGTDSVIARVIERTDSGIRLAIECYLSPGHERRQDVRIYDKVYYHAGLICHANEKVRLLPAALERIRSNKLIIDSFLKGRYGYPHSDESAFQNQTPLDQNLWEINRKLDLLIHMFLAEEFRSLMSGSPMDVNISASGIRFISEAPYELGDLVEVHLVLPMVPLLFVRLAGEVVRVKTLRSSQAKRYAVAVKYHQVDTDTREDIIRYLFKRQREILRKRHP